MKDQQKARWIGTAVLNFWTWAQAYPKLALVLLLALSIGVTQAATAAGIALGFIPMPAATMPLADDVKRQLDEQAKVMALLNTEVAVLKTQTANTASSLAEIKGSVSRIEDQFDKYSDRIDDKLDRLLRR